MWRSINRAELESAQRRAAAGQAAERGDRDGFIEILFAAPRKRWLCCARPLDVGEAARAAILVFDALNGDSILHCACRATSGQLVSELIAGRHVLFMFKILNIILIKKLWNACSHLTGIRGPQGESCPPLHPTLVNFALQTPLHVAAAAGSEECVRSLLEGGASLIVDAHDIGGNVALDYALDAERWPVVALLCSAGAAPRASSRFRTADIPPLPGTKGSPSRPPSLTGLLQSAVRSAIVRTQEARLEKVTRPRAGAEAQLTTLPSTDAVLEHRAAAIARVSRALQTEPQRAEQALSACGWDEARCLASWTSPQSARPPVVRGGSGARATGSGGEPGPALPPAAGDECLVCFEDLGVAGAPQLRLECRHAVCAACWTAHVVARCDMGDAGRGVPCPAGFCGLTASLQQLAPVIAPAALTRLRALTATAFVNNNPSSLRWCPHPGCGSVVAVGPTQDRRFAAEAALSGRALNVACDACSHRFCWSCGCAAHEPAGCAQMRSWEASLHAAAAVGLQATESWVAVNTKRCPGCRADVQKRDGCNHITCRCGEQWCWACGRSWALHSALTGGHYKCTLAALRDDSAAASAAAPRPPLQPQFADELRAAAQASQTHDAAAYGKAHANAEAMREALKAAVAAAQSCGKDAWAAEQAALAEWIAAVDAVLRDAMAAVCNAHIMLWHMPPCAQRAYCEDLVRRLENSCIFLTAALSLPALLAASPPAAVSPQTASQRAGARPGGLWGAVGLLARAAAYLLPPRQPQQPGSPAASAFLKAQALAAPEASHAELESVCEAAKADTDRLLCSVRSGVVSAPPFHWAEGRSAWGAHAAASVAVATTLARAAGSLALSAWHGAKALLRHEER